MMYIYIYDTFAALPTINAKLSPKISPKYRQIIAKPKLNQSQTKAKPNQSRTPRVKVNRSPVSNGEIEDEDPRSLPSPRHSAGGRCLLRRERGIRGTRARGKR